MLIDCNRCEAVVDAKVLHSYDYFNEIVGVPTKYSFLKCPKCELPFVVVRERYGNDWEDPFRLYPQHDKAVNPLFPNTIRLSYEEAHSCYKVKAYTATAIMCRKTLEGLCDEHKIKTRNLASSLKKMKENGIIENRLFEWAEALRISGNEAAHNVNITISRQDAKDILDFTEALLEYVFTFRDKFNEFMSRREKE